MSSNTPNLDLLKMDGVADGNKTFNIETMLNENWDKIDEAVGNMDFEVIDSYISEDKTLPPSADALRRGLETKQNVVRLADNYKKAAALPTEYPDGISFFKITGGIANGWPCDFGNVTTERTGSSATQMVKEVVTSSDAADKSGRVFVRNKRDANAGWQPFDELTRATQLATHTSNVAKHNAFFRATWVAGSGTSGYYKAIMPDLPDVSILPEGFEAIMIPNIANPAGQITDSHEFRIYNSGETRFLGGYIQRSNGTKYADGAIKAGVPLPLVIVHKNGNPYFLARSAPPVGNATAAQVLAGYTFQSEAVPDGGVGAAEKNVSGVIDLMDIQQDATTQTYDRYVPIAVLEAGIKFFTTAPKDRNGGGNYYSRSTINANGVIWLALIQNGVNIGQVYLTTTGDQTNNGWYLDMLRFDAATKLLQTAIRGSQNSSASRNFVTATGYNPALPLTLSLRFVKSDTGNYSIQALQANRDSLFYG